MNTHLKTILRMAVLGTTLMATSVSTWAGAANDGRVVVTNTQAQRSAIGSMVRARFSANALEYIGCKSQTRSTSSWTTCYAQDSAGRSLLCGSGDPKYLEVIHAMTESSQISFGVDLNGTGCYGINMYEGSDLLR